MRIVLLKNIPDLGLRGEIKEVKKGFARNWLMPHNLARPAQKADVLNYQKTLEVQKEKKVRIAEKEKELIKALDNLEIEIPAKASDQRRLYSSIDKASIRKALAAKNIEVEEENIELNAPFKELGEYEIKLKFLTQKAASSIKIKIIPEIQVSLEEKKE